MKRFYIFLLSVLLSVVSYGQKSWTTTWATAPEFTGKCDMPQKATLASNSIRQIVHISIGGKTLRLWLSNKYGNKPVEIKSVYIADALDSSLINKSTAKYITFGKKRGIVLKQGEEIASDALKYNLKPLQRLAITINYGATPENMTSHRGSRTNSYIVNGQLSPKQNVKTIEKLAHWYNIMAIDVMGEGNAAVAAIGNSITDGRGTTTDAQNRWTDVLAEQLQANGVTKMSVLNLGIGGACLYYGGPNAAVNRFDTDVLAQRGVKKVIIFDGVNDIGCSNNDAEARAKKLIETLEAMAEKAHAKNLKVYCATITPFGNSLYDGYFKEAARMVVNDWIRKAKCFDGVIDFDKVVRDETKPNTLQEKYSSDWLHLNPEGYKALGKYAAECLLKE